MSFVLKGFIERVLNLHSSMYTQLKFLRLAPKMQVLTRNIYKKENWTTRTDSMKVRQNLHNEHSSNCTSFLRDREDVQLFLLQLSDNLWWDNKNVQYHCAA